MTADGLWHLMGGPTWMNPRHCVMHARLVSMSARLAHVPEIAIASANYQSAWQLALDSNAPAEVLQHRQNDAITLGCELGNLLMRRDAGPVAPGESPVIMNANPLLAFTRR
jgi:hypothetical protein